MWVVEGLGGMCACVYECVRQRPVWPSLGVASVPMDGKVFQARSQAMGSVFGVRELPLSSCSCFSPFAFSRGSSDGK